MFKVYANTEKNRLYLHIKRLYRREVPALIKKIEAEVKKLNDQFTCITDLRYYSKKLRNEDKNIQYVQNLLVESGMRRVVRVHSTQTAETESQFEAISQQTAGYSAYSTTSIKIAEKILDDLT